MPQNENFTDDQKLAIFSANLEAVRTSRIERTRQLFVLSYLGIGLLATLFDKLCWDWIDIIWWSAGILFVLNILILLRLNRLNADYLELELPFDKNKKEEERKKLEYLGKWPIWLLVFGIIFSTIFILLRTYGSELLFFLHFIFDNLYLG